MAKIPLLILSFLLLTLHSLSQNPNPNSAYEELKLRGFPVGLLPADVSSYSLNRTSGEFSVDLGGRCQLLLPPDNYLASYSRRVTGKLLDGRIDDLDGIKVRAFFSWWSITRIRSSGEDLVFEVGVASAKYPAKNFDESQECEGRRKKNRKVADY
ncbi:uncharacterized protein M6B38_301755 [Iris pallida]|uniref:DUF538 family protein n=1 Tax=Iris pallida TaxID=29817 RepID=A0AAX6GWW1_IRIPA|nr:uncharacterized protein M6B38_342940 [Iris pallida]KAJ6842581.1 uncharacterized protein M6B38_301755 [Iris pallida]